MKPSLNTMGVALIAALMLTCCTEDTQVANDKLNVTFNIDLVEEGTGQLESVTIPHGAIVLISIETENGEVVIDQEPVAIRKNDSGYVTAPLHLTKGNYRLVDLMVADESGEVLFAAPREGSALSKKVSRSLPYEITNEMQVDTRLSLVDTRKKAPKHFGYDCFRGKQHTLKVQVFTSEEDGAVHRATAEALIMKGLDTIRTYTLNNVMNFVTFKGTPGETYSLVVVKDSYARFSKDFKVNQIPAKPLKVVLQPALTLVGVTTGDNNRFGMQLDAAWGTFDFHIDWGDGTSEIFSPVTTTGVDHSYAHPGKYFISITGNGLDSVVLVGNLIGAGEIERVGLKHLVNLFDFVLEYARGPETIDLTNNKQLMYVLLYPHPLDPSPSLKTLLIPNDANIISLEVIGHTSLTSESINNVIDALHHQITTINPRRGTFDFSRSDDNNTPIAIPSESSMEKLREMKHTYNWFILPDPDGEPL